MHPVQELLKKHFPDTRFTEKAKEETIDGEDIRSQRAEELIDGLTKAGIDPKLFQGFGKN